MKKLLAILVTVTLVGCGGGQSEEEKAAAKRQKEADREALARDVNDAVETVTGSKAVRSGRKAEDQVRQIQADYNRKMEQVLEETE